MGRPRKDEHLLMNRSLRIMLTGEQDRLIRRAAKRAGLDMTAWARPILLEAAREQIAKAERRRAK